MNRFLVSALAPAAALPLLLDASLKSMALLMTASVCVLLMRRASAAARHVVWLSAVAALLVLPVLSVALPGWRILPAWAQVAAPAKPPVPQTPRPAAVAPENTSSAPHETYLPDAPPAPPESASPGAPTAAAAAAANTPAPAPPARSAPVPLLPLWLAGCSLLLLRLLVARWSLGRTEQRCSAPAPGSRLSQAFRMALPDSGVRRRVTLLVDADRTIPVVWGVLSPRLLMPAEAETWPAAQLRSVFLHELAHLRRRDPLAQLLTQLACALHWFNPLVWLAAWRLHVERERACDDIVLSRGVKPSAYAEHLLHVATQLSPARWTHACGLAMARKSSLEGRLLAVLSEKLNRRDVTRALTIAALSLAALVAIPIAMMKAADENPRSGMEYKTSAGSLWVRHENGKPSYIIAATFPWKLRVSDYFPPPGLGAEQEQSCEITLPDDRVIDLRAYVPNPKELRHGKETFDLSKGRVFLVSQDGTVRQSTAEAPAISNEKEATAFFAQLTVEAQAATSRRKVDWSNPPDMSFFEGKYDPELLASLAANPAKLSGDGESGRKVWPLAEQILRAAVEGDPQFRHLLTDEKLKAADIDNRILTMSLAAYDYSVFGNKNALKVILDQLKSGHREAYLAAFPLGFVDEWDESIPAMEKCFTKLDGAVGEEHGRFWIHREWLFPESLAAFHQKQLAAKKLDAASLRGVWSGSHDGVSVMLRFGEKPGWEIRQAKTVEAELTTTPSSYGRALYLMGTDDDGKAVHCGTVTSRDDGTKVLSVLEHGGKREQRGYRSVSGLILTKQDPSNDPATTLDPATEAQLDWGEAVNGLRGAIVIRPAAPGAEPAIFLAVQNVSAASVRFADTVAAEDLRKLYVSDSKVILFALTSGVPTQTDVTLQPREVAYLRLLEPVASDQKSVEPTMIEGLRKDSLQTWRAVLDLQQSPDGAWKGRLTTGETRGSTAPNGPQPKNAAAQALFKAWLPHARLNGDIPGGLVRLLHEKVKEFIRNNEPDASGGPYAQKMKPLEPRFGELRDWKPAELVALLDDIAAAHTIPLETTLTHLAEATLQPGQPLPPASAEAAWGQPLPGGLRMAYVLEPQADAYHIGTEVKARMVLHNAGKEPVTFVTHSFQQPGHTARLADGTALTLDSTYWTTLGRPVAYRLAPGECCEIHTPGLGIGAADKDRDDWANVRAGSWITCQAGNDVRFSPGAALLSRKNEQADGDGWWLEFITQRLECEAPLPTDLKEREYLLYRVVRDLYGAAPSTTEGDAFAADTSPDALKNLAALLAKHPYGTQVHGPIRGGDMSFKVLPPDPDAATRVRVASNPGYYTLRDDLKLSVSRRPAGQRVLNEASLIYFQQGKDNAITKVELPDAYNTWAAAAEPGIPVLWIKQKDLVRRYDFTDPSAIKETRYEGTQSAEAPIPARVLEAMKPVFNTPQAPAQQQNSPPPAAPATGKPTGAALTPAEMQERYYAARKKSGEPMPVGIGARAVLIRRLTLDITGELPTEEERSAFDNDGAPDALGKVIARLVAKAGKVPPGLLDAERETARSDKRIGADTGPRRKVDWSKFPSYDELANPFDPTEALRLAAKPKKTNEDTRRLMFLLLQAAVEKAPELAPLLEDSAMKQHDDDYHSLSLGLAVYDFALNGKKESLKFICDELAKEEPGSDAQATVAMGFLDEWETSIAAHERHFARGADGAGAESLGLFWEQRAFLFPESWGRFHAERLKASGLDGASLRGVWKSVEGPVGVELRLGDDQRWEVKWEGNTITANLTTRPQSGGKALALIGKAHCGLVSREDETTLLLSIWNDGVTAPSYPTVNGIVLKKHDDVPATDPPQGAAAKLTPDALLGAWRGTVNGEKLMLSFHRPPAEKDVQCDIYTGDATIGALAAFTITDDGSSAEVVQHSAGGGMKFGTLIPDEPGKLKLELYGRQKGQQETMLTRDAETAASEPQQKEARELLAMWKSAAYGSETISGLFLWTLVTEAQACAGANPNLDSSSKLLELLDSRITERDWTQPQVIQLLNDVAAVSDEPLKACLASERLAHGWLGTWEGKVGGRACSLWIVRRGPAVTGITMQMLYPEEADVDDLVYNANSNRVTLDLRRYSADGKPSPFGRLESVSDTELRFIPTGTEAGGGGVILTRKTEVPPTEPAEQIARELFTHWKSTANADGSIPGTFIGQLATEVRAFGKAHAGRVHADNIVRLLPRFITSRDWTQAETIRLLDDVAYYSTEPIAALVAANHLPDGPLWRTDVDFQDIPVTIGNWCEPLRGLRLGMRVVEGDWRVGGKVRVELWLHNAGDTDVTFTGTDPHRSDAGVNAVAKGTDGKEHYALTGNFRLTAPQRPHTLRAGHVAMVKAFDLPFAEGESEKQPRNSPAFIGLLPGKYSLLCSWTDAAGLYEGREWHGTLTAPEVEFTLAPPTAGATPARTSDATADVKPTREYAQRLFGKWQARARTDGRIPGALIGQLAEKVDQFIAQQKNTEEAKKLAALTPRLVSSHDWAAADVAALLDEIEAIHSAPIGWSDLPIEFDRFRQIRTGTPLPDALKEAAWGAPADNGLRAAWLLEPTAPTYPLGSVLKARVLFHNTGKSPVTFRTETWHQADQHTAKDASGREIKVRTTWSTGITPLAVYRLAPNDYAEVAAPGVAIGAGEYEEEFSTGRIGIVIEAPEGAEVSLSHTVDAAQGIQFSRPDDPKTPGDLWKKTVADRVAEEAPCPVSKADRGQLIRRVALDLTGQPPSDAGIAAFVADDSADPLGNLTRQLQAMPYEEPWTGKLPTGVTKFRVTAADPEAAKKPRVATGPGRYMLGDGVQLQVTQISTEGRRENKAQIVFSNSDAKAPAPHPPYDIALPDGLGTYAIVWTRGTGDLKVVERGSVRTIDFKKPDAIADERAKENLGPEIRNVLPPGLLQTGALRTIKPERTHLFNDTHSAIAVQSGSDVRFVLAAKGMLSSGIGEWETSKPKAAWGFEGTVNLVDVGKTKAAGHNVDLRSFKIRYTSENPDVLFLDDKPLPLGHPGAAGRLITLREKGETEWTSRLLPLRTQADLEAIGHVLDGTEGAALDAVPGRADSEGSGRSRK